MIERHKDKLVQVNTQQAFVRRFTIQNDADLIKEANNNSVSFEVLRFLGNILSYDVLRKSFQNFLSNCFPEMMIRIGL